MSTTNQGWYGVNASRAYPVDDRATSLDDSGNYLPQNILVDAHLRFPNSLASYVFIGAVSTTRSLVTLTLLGSDSEDTADAYVPVAAITVRKPVTPYRMYAVEAQAEGVAGWVVFGDGVSDAALYTGRFSSPEQSRLTPRCANSYQALPIASIGKKGSSVALTGLVHLKAGSDLEIVGGCRRVPRRWPLDASQECGPPLNVYDGRDYYNPWRRVIVIRLAGSERGQTNVLSKYVGKCDKRPESGTCGDPQPIETIGGVPPDCDGTVTLELQGCASITEIVEEVTLDGSGDSVTSAAAAGVIVDCAMGLADTCQRTIVAQDTGEGCIVSSMILAEADEIDACEATKLIAPRLDAVAQLAARTADSRFRIGESFESTTNFVGQTQPPTGFVLTSGSLVIVDGGTLAGVERRWVRSVTTPMACFYNRGGVQPASWNYKKLAVGIQHGVSGRLLFGRRVNGDYNFVEFDRTGTLWGEVGLRIGVNESGVDRTIHSVEIPTLPPLSLSDADEARLGFGLRVTITPDPDGAAISRVWLTATLHISGRGAGYVPLAGTISAAVCDFEAYGLAGFGALTADSDFTGFTAENM